LDNAANANDNGKHARIGKTSPPHKKQQPLTAVQMARLVASVTIVVLSRTLSNPWRQLTTSNFYSCLLTSESRNPPNPD
jgi:hypothetical protein